MAISIEQLDTPEKLIAAMKASIVRLDEADHVAVSRFVEETDKIQKILPATSAAFTDIAADMDAVISDVPPAGAEDVLQFVALPDAQ